MTSKRSHHLITLLINFIRSEGKEIQKHLIKIGPFTLLLVYAGQNILYTYVHISDWPCVCIYIYIYIYIWFIPVSPTFRIYIPVIPIM